MLPHTEQHQHSWCYQTRTDLEEDGQERLDREQGQANETCQGMGADRKQTVSQQAEPRITKKLYQQRPSSQSLSPFKNRFSRGNKRGDTTDCTRCEEEEETRQDFRMGFLSLGLDSLLSSHQTTNNKHYLLTSSC